MMGRPLRCIYKKDIIGGGGVSHEMRECLGVVVLGVGCREE